MPDVGKAHSAAVHEQHHQATCTHAGSSAVHAQQHQAVHAHAGVFLVNAALQCAASRHRVCSRAGLDKSVYTYLRCWAGMVLGVLCDVHDLCGVLCLLDAQRAPRRQDRLQVG